MKTLNTYINETLTCSHSEHINEWRASSNTVSSIKKKNIQYFVYKLTTTKKIKIFDRAWPQFKDYKDKVYVNDEQLEIGEYGYTKKDYEPGTYEVEIKDIDNVTNCKYMFYNCDQLVSVPLFNTSKVKDMWQMFFNCKGVREIPLFNTKNVEVMTEMFWDCNSLSEQTKKEWSKVYDFEYNEMKK